MMQKKRIYTGKKAVKFYKELSEQGERSQEQSSRGLITDEDDKAWAGWEATGGECQFFG